MSKKLSARLQVGYFDDHIAPCQPCHPKGFQANATKPKLSVRLQVEYLNDYIAPCQPCHPKGFQVNVTKPKVSIAKEQVQTVQSEPLKISSRTCVACSGCETSKESVSLPKQSLDEFLSSVNKGNNVIVSLSPQSRASLAVHFGISPLQLFKKLTTFFKSMGVKAIFDTSCGRDLTLVESCMEFITRYRQKHFVNDERSKSSLPMIASACPGWISHAEKELGSYDLPHISAVKSPQQTMGTIIKNYLCRDMGLRPEEVYHITVMPCYEKKLEAVRDDFVFQLETHDEGCGSAANMISEVDSVLTTEEVLELIQLKDVDFKSIEESPLDRLLTNINEEGYLFGVRGGSGGYAETVFCYAARTLFGRQIVGPLNFTTIRNSDFQEVALEVEGKTVLRFALCYGFSNMTNVVRKLKTGKCDYHFLEIMKCSSGCLNGNGQIIAQTKQSPKALCQLLEALNRENVWEADPFNNPIVRGLYDKWLEQPGSEKAKRFMHTQYHPVEKNISSQLHNW
ncbi:hypothetical protein RJT34_09168 [Clitoria ternatea]|uniref:Iron hydrogenase small subunit domain-containing protein n=1 Tax=Clitoria ternatea TaxID=43366 RepID=A0AAN9PW73_CLITE